jgi:uncharacterized protein
VKILIAGASGFIGKRLVKELCEAGWEVIILGRDLAKLKRHFADPVQRLTWQMLDDFSPSGLDAIINLCGYNIAAKPWSKKVKNALIASRVRTTESLIAWASKQPLKPRVICANAVGIYGMHDGSDDSEFDEASYIDFAHPRDFLSEIGVRWQQALEPAIAAGISVVSLRFGVVLGKDGGMLKKLALSFSLGLGSIVGDGKQIISWIHIGDVTSAILFLLNKPALSGAFNLTAPQPLSQAEFARSLASQMHRPLFLKIPAVMVRAIFGEMGEALLLKGQRVLPTRLMQEGYNFLHQDINSALAQEYAKGN